MIDKEHGWLGPSPDALISDGTLGKGCAELKALVSCWGMTIFEALNSSRNLCLELANSDKTSLKLKQKHTYYHQSQLQLFVGRDIYHWCHFVVATWSDVFIERITLNREWVSASIHELENFFDAFVLPTILDKSPWDSTAIFIFFCHFSVPS